MSGVSGLVTTTLICPVDMIKTNTFVGHERKLPYQVAREILREHGPRGLFRGCARMGVEGLSCLGFCAAACADHFYC